MIHTSFKNLKIWAKSRSLVQDIYILTKDFPRNELYGLTNQMRRAAISIPSNIAEGSQRTTSKEFGHFITIAKGSLAELHTQIILAMDLGYTSKNGADILMGKIEEIDKMMRSFHAKLLS